jgi:hypothetical protein
VTLPLNLFLALQKLGVAAPTTLAQVGGAVAAVEAKRAEFAALTAADKARIEAKETKAKREAEGLDNVVTVRVVAATDSAVTVEVAAN